MKRELFAYINNDLVGTLYENSGIWSFHYDAGWVKHGYALCPGLPLTTARHDDGGTTRPVQWYFDNLLPEEDARRQTITYMQNQTISVDAWSMLAYFGAESAGALTLLSAGQTLPGSGLRPLSDATLDERIKAMNRQPLSAKAPKKMSLAGAQQKLAIVMIDGDLFEPIGSCASTHILKPDVLSEHYPCSAVNEWFCARLARQMGLSVPNVELRYVPSPVYIVERFDRKRTGDLVERLHTLDALQLLNLSAGAKYAQSGIRALTDVLAHCRTPAQARVTLFKWTLFNILIGNSDAHLKNLSFLAGANGYEIAPHYDLLSTGAWSRPELLHQSEARWPGIEMSYPVSGVLQYQDLRREHLEAFAGELGIRRTSFSREFNKMVSGIAAAAEKLEAEFEARTDVPPAVRASQRHMLRCIRYLPIETMTQQFQRPN